MSHSKERAEKICLNCNAALQGRYCHVCGQENTEPKETVWHLVTHFFNDITHFDGKFFTSTWLLISRPGFLSKEYIKGRRAGYLNPIRMYVFSSALFFLVFYSAFGPQHLHIGEKDRQVMFGKDSLSQANLDQLLRESGDDSATVKQTISQLKDLGLITTPVADSVKHDKKGGIAIIGDNETKRRYNTVAAYDSAQQALPSGKRHGFIRRGLEHREIEIREKYGDDGEAFMKELMEKFFHTFPYLLFVSLPLYALFLKLLYVRHKQFYYVDHAMFLIHLYIFTFMFLMSYIGLLELVKFWGSWIGYLLITLFMLSGVYYAFRAMHKFYEQGRGTTLAKFILFNLMAGISLTLLFIIFFGFAFYKM